MILQVAKRIANVRFTVIENYVNREKSKNTAEKREEMFVFSAVFFVCY